MADIGACLFDTAFNTLVLPAITGVDYTFYLAFRDEIEAVPGVYDFTGLDPIIAGAVAAGITPYLKIGVNSDPALRVPPANLIDYAAFVTAIATHYLGTVTKYAIENELGAAPAFTEATYLPVRQAAYNAIHAVDPGASVLDCGLVQPNWLMYRAQELVTAGDPWGALSAVNRFSEHCRRQPQQYYPATLPDLYTWLASAYAIRVIGLVHDTITNGFRDAIQIHYLQDNWEFVPEFMSWLATWAPGVPIEVWEAGYGWDDEDTEDTSTYDEDQHSAGLIRTLAGLAGQGAVTVLQEPYYAVNVVGDSSRWGRGLNQAGVGLVPAATAFSYLSATIGGLAATVENWGTGVHAYSFGATPVYVAWAEQPAIVDLVTLEGFANEALIANIYGAEKYISAQVVPLGPMPIYIVSSDQSIQGSWIKRQ
jgi:hypothetical protein